MQTESRHTDPISQTRVCARVVFKPAHMIQIVCYRSGIDLSIPWKILVLELQHYVSDLAGAVHVSYVIFDIKANFAKGSLKQHGGTRGNTCGT